MTAILKATRPLNLVIIAFTMAMMHFSIMRPIVNHMLALEIIYSVHYFWLLVLSVVLIAAAGYVQNDLMDVDSDTANGKDKVLLENQSLANGFIWVAGLSGIGIGVFLANASGFIMLGLIQALTFVTLWFYNMQLKHQPVVGNLVIAVFTAMVPLTVGLFEIPQLNMIYPPMLAKQGIDFNFNFVAFWILGFSAFAFLGNFSREVIKDLEDLHGDQTVSSETIPVAYGTAVAKGAAIAPLLAIVGLLLYFPNTYLDDIITKVYFYVVLLPVTGLAALLIVKARTSHQYSRVSSLLKVLMVLGVSYAFLAQYIVLQMATEGGSFGDIMKLFFSA